MSCETCVFELPDVENTCVLRFTVIQGTIQGTVKACVPCVCPGTEPELGTTDDCDDHHDDAHDDDDDCDDHHHDHENWGGDCCAMGAFIQQVGSFVQFLLYAEGFKLVLLGIALMFSLSGRF